MANKTYLVLLPILLLGCSGGGEMPDRPATSPVSGTVTYNGDPLAGATVTFRSTVRGGRGAVGVTDDTGSYQLMTFEKGDGAVPGNYTISVIKQEHTPGDPSYNDSDSENYGKAPPPEAQSTTTDLIPTKYADGNTSGLTATVTEGENTLFQELMD